MILRTYSTAHDQAKFLALFSTLPGRYRENSQDQGSPSPDFLHQLLELPLSVPKEFWILMDGESPVASLGATVSSTDANRGYIGFMEFDVRHPQAMLSLLSGACAFLKSLGCKTVYGPMHYNTWFPYRYRVDDEARHFAWEPDRMLRYNDILKQAGFKTDKIYHSTGFGAMNEYLEATRPSYDRAIREGFSFRRIDFSNGIETEILALHQLTHKSFQHNYLFEPLPLPLFAELLRRNKKQNTSYSFILSSPEAQDVGFIFAFKDTPVARPDEHYVVVKTLSIAPEARGKGLSNALTYSAFYEGLSDGIDAGVAALVRSGIQSESYARKGKFLWSHQYGLFKQSLLE